MKDLFARLTFTRTVIFGLVLTAFYYFMVFDDGSTQLNAIQATQVQIQTLNSEISGVQGKLDRSREFQDATKELGQSINKLLEFIPSNFKMGEFMKIVSTEARLAGLQIKKISPIQNMNEKSIPEFSELAVNLEVQGQFSQVLKFMASLTQKKQIFIYESLKMSQDVTGAANGLINVTADIRAYDYIGANANAAN